MKILKKFKNEISHSCAVFYGLGNDGLIYQTAANNKAKLIWLCSSTIPGNLKLINKISKEFGHLLVFL